MAGVRALFTRRRVFIGLGLLAGLFVFLYIKWREAGDRGGQQPVTPFRIAGNLYYVGMNDISAFLITGPEGHVLIDGGYPSNASIIIDEIAKLGFSIKDVKVLLNSEPHFDHAGGMAALQRASGAELWASEPSAITLEARGIDTDMPWYVRTLQRVIAYPAPRVHRRFVDGDTLRLGLIAIAAHITPGHTRGCTTYSFKVQDDGRTLEVVSACSLIKFGIGNYDGQDADFERTFAMLRSLPADIWITSHGRLWGRYRKFARMDSLASRLDAFIDREGYRAYVDSGESEFRRGVVH